MARKGITYDQVANAARTIKARGQEPTIAAIRVECGDEGSYTTISQHLAKWRAEEMDKVDTRSLPPEVEDKMMEALMTVWNIANKSASHDLAAIKQEHADELKRLRSELETANKEIEGLEEKLAASEKDATKAKESALQAEKTTTGMRSELEATKRLYGQLLEGLKQPKDQAQKAADTKTERQPKKVAAPGSKQA